MPKSLIKLALEGTEEARKRLFAQVSELVITDLEQRTDQELAIFSEVILKLYSVGSSQDRSKLARKLAGQPNTPHELACRIAEDDVKIAMPVLASSPVFTQEDLLDFVERLSNAHLQVLARRTDLSTGVSDAMAEKGDRPVHRILAGNREIRLSRETMLKFVQYAAKDPVLREDLALRPDLSPAVCRALLPLVEGKARKRLRSIIEGALTQEQLDQIARLKQIRRDFGAVLEITDTSRLWQEAERAEITVNELMILLLQDVRLEHAVELLALRGRIAQTTLKDAVFNGKQDLVVRTAEKAGLDTSTFALFAKTRCEQLKLPLAEGSEWTAAYKRHLESIAMTRQSRCGDFQANRKDKKPAFGGGVSAGGPEK